MEWFVSAWNSDTGRSVVRVGDAPDREAAIVEAVRVGRSLTHADDGSPVGSARNFRFGEGDVVSIADVGSDDAEARVHRELAYASQLTDPAPASGSVAEQWNRIATWLGKNLTDVRIAGADDDAITAAAVATAANWHDDLRSFYGLINGFPHDHWVSLLPMHELFDLDRLLDERQLELEVWGEIDEEMGEEPSRTTPAGVSVGTFLPEFVPFAGMDGYLLFVDMRGGPSYGCVTAFDKVDADQGGPKWPSLGAMLADLADSLETGGEFDEQWTPHVVDGKLSWDLNAHGV
ncbi:SMI1/KNR4 family protein [Rhodococcoides yunnanense]|uniref:SMI1/KNR4 family protein n=1 Tax=Rhodococcoides yunnanense TaxID=278209 RepID=UPI00093426A1|nr:SMI1/KNR4 family protein [Rhodococcus yunnanensis]